MKTITLIMVTLVLLFAACTQSQIIPGPVKSTDVSQLSYPSTPAVGANISNPLSIDDNIFFYNNNQTENPYKVGVYGYNSTNQTQNESVLVNTSRTTNASTLTYKYIVRLTFNATRNDSVLIYENTSRRLIAVVNNSVTDVYVDTRPDAQLIVPDYIPNLCQNTSAITTRQYTFMTTYIACGLNANLSVTPFVSPGQGIWAAQSGAISCRNNITTQSFTDITPQYVKYQVCSVNNGSDYALIGLIGK